MSPPADPPSFSLTHRTRPLRSCRERASSAVGMGVYRPTCVSLLPCTEWILKHYAHRSPAGGDGEEPKPNWSTSNATGEKKRVIKGDTEREEKQGFEEGSVCPDDLQKRDPGDKGQNRNRERDIDSMETKEERGTGSYEGVGECPDFRRNKRRDSHGEEGREEGERHVLQENGEASFTYDLSLENIPCGESVCEGEGFDIVKECAVFQNNKVHSSVRTQQGCRAPPSADPPGQLASSASHHSSPPGLNAVPDRPLAPHSSPLSSSRSSCVLDSASHDSDNSAHASLSPSSPGVTSTRDFSSLQCVLSFSNVSPGNLLSSDCISRSPSSPSPRVSSSSLSPPASCDSSKASSLSPPRSSAVAVAQISRVGQSNGAWPSTLLDAPEHAKAWSRFYLYHADSHAPFNSFDSEQAVMLLFRLLPSFSLSQGEVMVEVGHGSCPLIPFIWERVKKNAIKKSKTHQCEDIMTARESESGLLFSSGEVEEGQRSKDKAAKISLRSRCEGVEGEASASSTCSRVSSSTDQTPLVTSACEDEISPADQPRECLEKHEVRKGRKSRSTTRDVENNAFSGGLYVGIESCREAAEAALRLHGDSQLPRRRKTTSFQSTKGERLSQRSGGPCSVSLASTSDLISRDEKNLIGHPENWKEVISDSEEGGQYLLGVPTERQSTEADIHSSVLKDQDSESDAYRQDATSDSCTDRHPPNPSLDEKRVEPEMGDTEHGPTERSRPEHLSRGLPELDGEGDNASNRLQRGSESLTAEKLEEDEGDKSFAVAPNKKGRGRRNRDAEVSLGVSGLPDVNRASTLRRMLRLGCLEFAVCTDGFNYVDDQGRIYLKKICLDDEALNLEVSASPQTRNGSEPPNVGQEEASFQGRQSQEDNEEKEKQTDLHLRPDGVSLQENHSAASSPSFPSDLKLLLSTSGSREGSEPIIPAGIMPTSFPSSSCSPALSPSQSRTFSALASESSFAESSAGLPDAFRPRVEERDKKRDSGSSVLADSPLPPQNLAPSSSSSPTLLTDRGEEFLPCSPCCSSASPTPEYPCLPTLMSSSSSESCNPRSTCSTAPSLRSCSVVSPSPPFSSSPSLRRSSSSASLTACLSPLASVTRGSVKYIVLKSTLDSICVMLPCTGTLNWDEDLRIPRSLVVWFDSFARLLRSPGARLSAIGSSSNPGPPSDAVGDKQKLTQEETEASKYPASAPDARSSSKHGQTGVAPSVRDESERREGCCAIKQDGTSRKRSRVEEGEGADPRHEKNNGETHDEDDDTAALLPVRKGEEEDEGDKTQMHGEEKKQKRRKKKGGKEDGEDDPNSSKSFLIFLEPRNKARIHLLTIIKVIFTATFTSRPSPARHFRLCRIFCSRARGQEKAVGYLLEKRDSVYTSYAELYGDVVEVTKVLKKLDPYGEFDDLLPPFAPPKWRSEEPEDIEILVDYVWSEPTAEKVRKRTGAVGGGLVCLDGPPEDTSQDIAEPPEPENRRSTKTRGRGRGGRGRRRGRRLDGSKRALDGEESK
ncbi:hypothetical protein CSUI_002233 [Cystoisospora suis]|uniref:Uncharacterized protein n=1 Tax=Cystoisospora suis TaxID=483139 RepID=A0A2C6L9N4_9APIC|nr:hypothetical protein CSUI_002233 [Cystoisospora suis]